MGLNLETLIGILVVLIVLILGDGIRRMIRDRNSRLRVRIDPRVRDLPDEPEEPRNAELVSGPRVVSRTAVTAQAPVAEPAEVPQAPPLMMEKEDKPEPVPATQQDLFGESARKSEAIAREPAPAAPVVEPGEPEEPQQAAVVPKQILEVIVLHLVANEGVRVPGRDLLQQLLEQGMRFGEMNIFHRHRQTASGNDELLFSMANALEPGTFDIDSMEDATFRAVTFFLKLPGPAKPMEAFDKMLATARKLAQTLDAELRDEQHSVLTPQTAEHLRVRVQDFERRQRLADAH